MKFLTYLLIALGFAAWAQYERAMEGIGKGMLGQGHNGIMFWILIGFSFFFWLCAYGTMVEERETKPPADDNPF